MNGPWGIPWNIFLVYLTGGPLAILFAFILIHSKWWNNLVSSYYSIDSDEE